MVEACHKHGVLLMEAFAHRFHPHNVQVRQLIDDGRIGKVLRMSSVHSSARPAADDIRLSKELSGGVLMDKGCYCVNTARFIFGSEPVRVYATMEFGEFGRDSGVDERVVGTLEFPCGGVLQFDSGFKLAENNIYTRRATRSSESAATSTCPQALGRLRPIAQGSWWKPTSLLAMTRSQAR